LFAGPFQTYQSRVVASGSWADVQFFAGEKRHSPKAHTMRAVTGQRGTSAPVLLRRLQA